MAQKTYFKYYIHKLIKKSITYLQSQEMNFFLNQAKMACLVDKIPLIRQP